ncbi:inactive serine/threonine-protein kinase TEX14-like isoform X3 [Neophocaena asiaeorientalis asiaeorientalis]|uniref:Inactive serine/threonine-protein kinase TEX14-like isoform X3 n=1 Tax=Neophocaena asiaeorientalis asiaeorientalis TaxID=1706337 RepID=A0A341AG95_NEOAA|nr:inactive serine/threonine-protein kinase TEX14-like isoform X3 [Neophocaena asiaeorientalis asiaeorientalis]
MRPGLAKVGSLEHGRTLHQLWLRPRPRQGYPWGGPGPGPGLPPPPELYPWLPLELICGNTPAATSDLYSFCILAQEVFTGQRVTPLPAPVRPPPVRVPQSCFLTRELPWAGREGPELETGESPALDPLVLAPHQALVRAGLGLGPADHWGSLQSTQYLLKKAMAQDSASEVSSPMDWTTLYPSPQGSPPGHGPQQSPEGCSLGLGQQLESQPQPLPRAQPHSQRQPGPLPGAQINSAQP